MPLHLSKKGDIPASDWYDTLPATARGNASDDILHKTLGKDEFTDPDEHGMEGKKTVRVINDELQRLDNDGCRNSVDLA